MKKLVLALTLALGLTACGGGSDNRPPEGAPGLWLELNDAAVADTLNFNSINDGSCTFFIEDSFFSELSGTLIEDSGDMFDVKSTGDELFINENAVGVMNEEGIVTLNLPDEIADLNVVPQVRFQMTGFDTAIGTTFFEQGSLSQREEVELIKISQDEFLNLADRVDRFCNR